MRTESKHALFIGYTHGGKLKRPGRLSRALVMRWASRSGGRRRSLCCSGQAALTCKLANAAAHFISSLTT
eukprot:1331743-Pleurochrysis_carterae.AAC.8